MHVIIGKGNLGVDLKIALEAIGYKAVILTKSEGFLWPGGYSQIMNHNPDHVWITAGFGSVQECSNNFSGALATHTAMPLELARDLPTYVKLGIFSTDYVANEKYPDSEIAFIDNAKTFYAMSKLWMERGIANSNRPLTSIFRVCSLYGQHFPEKTFPGKLLAKYPNPCELNLPENEVVPTPTWWIAKKLALNLEVLFLKKGRNILHVAPSGSTTTMEWGRRILGEDYTIKSSGLDPLRPIRSRLGSSIGQPPDWSALWDLSKGFFNDNYKGQNLR